MPPPISCRIRRLWQMSCAFPCKKVRKRGLVQGCVAGNRGTPLCLSPVGDDAVD